MKDHILELIEAIALFEKAYENLEAALDEVYSLLPALKKAVKDAKRYAR